MECRDAVDGMAADGGEMRFNPTPETTLEAGDVLIALGHKEQLGRLTLLARS